MEIKPAWLLEGTLSPKFRVLNADFLFSRSAFFHACGSGANGGRRQEDACRDWIFWSIRNIVYYIMYIDI